MSSMVNGEHNFSIVLKATIHAFFALSAACNNMIHVLVVTNMGQVVLARYSRNRQMSDEEEFELWKHLK